MSIPILLWVFIIFLLPPLFNTLAAIDWERVSVIRLIGRIHFELTPSWARRAEEWEKHRPKIPPPVEMRRRGLPHEEALKRWEEDPSQSYWPLLRQIEEEERNIPYRERWERETKRIKEERGHE